MIYDTYIFGNFAGKNGVIIAIFFGELNIFLEKHQATMDQQIVCLNSNKFQKGTQELGTSFMFFLEGQEGGRAGQKKRQNKARPPFRSDAIFLKIARVKERGSQTRAPHFSCWSNALVFFPHLPGEGC